MSKLDVREMAESRKAAAVPCRGIVRRRVSKAAYMRAVETEGPHVATAAGESWWREQERRHPFILAGGNKPEGTDAPNGSANRYGRVKERRRAGRWEHYENGQWVPGEITPRKGICGEARGERNVNGKP
jgi:hypothetical protein